MYQRKRNQFQNFQVTDFYLKIGIVSFCINFYDMYENKDFIKSKIIGWCPASKVFFEPKEDDRCLAVMLKSGRWCHMAYFCIVDGFDDPPMYDYFDYFNFEGLDRKIIDDYVTQKEWRL